MLWPLGPCYSGLQGAGSQQALCGMGARGRTCAGLSISLRSYRVDTTPVLPPFSPAVGSTPSAVCTDELVRVATDARASSPTWLECVPRGLELWKPGGGRKKWLRSCARERLSQTAASVDSPVITASVPHPCFLLPLSPSLLLQVTLYLSVSPCLLLRIPDDPCLLQRKRGVSHQLPK